MPDSHESETLVHPLASVALLIWAAVVCGMYYYNMLNVPGRMEKLLAFLQ